MSTGLVFYARLVVARKKERIDLTNRVLSFSFEDKERKADKLTLEINNWDLDNFDRARWAKGNMIEFSWGTTGSMSPARTLVIRKVTGSTVLKVEAVSKAFLMDTVPRVRTFENMKRSDVVIDIAKRLYGYSDLSLIVDDTEEVHASITQPGITDARFLQRLAAKEGFEFYVDFDGLHFHARNVKQRALREFTWTAGNVQARANTILNFSIENDVTNRPLVAVAGGRDLKRKKSFLIEAIPKQYLALDNEGQLAGSIVAAEAFARQFTDGLNTLKPFAQAVGRGTRRSSTDDAIILETQVTSEPTEKSAKKKVEGQLRRKRQLIVKMKMQIIGDPHLLAKTVVQINGIGETLTGLYYIKSVKHEMSSSGYTCDVDMIRDGKNRTSVRLFEGSGGLGGGKDLLKGGSCVTDTAVLIKVGTFLSQETANYIPRLLPVEDAGRITPLTNAKRRLDASLSALKSAGPSAREAETMHSSAQTILNVVENTIAFKGFIVQAGTQTAYMARKVSATCNAELSAALGKKALNDGRVTYATVKIDLGDRTAKAFVNKITGKTNIVFEDKRGRQ